MNAAARSRPRSALASASVASARSPGGRRVQARASSKLLRRRNERPSAEVPGGSRGPSGAALRPPTGRPAPREACAARRHCEERLGLAEPGVRSRGGRARCRSWARAARSQAGRVAGAARAARLGSAQRVGGIGTAAGSGVAVSGDAARGGATRRRVRSAIERWVASGVLVSNRPGRLRPLRGDPDREREERSGRLVQRRPEEGRRSRPRRSSWARPGRSAASSASMLGEPVPRGVNAVGCRREERLGDRDP